MVEWLVIGAIAVFGFKKGLALLIEGFVKGVLIGLGLIVDSILLCLFVGARG
jgi:hypothetical protein